MVNISRKIKVGSKGKVLADSALNKIKDARHCAVLCEHAYQDAKTADRTLSEEIDTAISVAAEWVRRANADVADAESIYDKDIYPVGYAPYWSAPDVIHLHPGTAVAGWIQGAGGFRIGENRILRGHGSDLTGPQARQRGIDWGSVDEYTTDPSKGDVLLRPARALSTDGGQWLRCTLGNLPPNFATREGTVHSVLTAPTHRGPNNVRAEGVFGGDDSRRAFNLVSAFIVTHDFEWISLQEWGGRVLTLPIILTSSKSGLQTQVELKLVVFNGRTIADSYIDRMNIVRGSLEHFDELETRPDELAFGTPLGWRSQELAPRE